MKSKLDNEIELKRIINESLNFQEVLNKMGYTTGAGMYKTLYKYIDKFKIDITHLRSYKRKRGKFVKTEEILSNNKPFNNTNDLKVRLYKEGLKEKKCELCGQGEEWQGKKMSLILDHIDGNNKNNSLNNLQIVCPNCDATLDTFKGRNMKPKQGGITLDKRKYTIQGRKEEKKKRIEEIINQNVIDFSKSNWGIELGKLINMHHSNTRNNVKNLFPEFYKNKCFKRNW